MPELLQDVPARRRTPRLRPGTAGLASIGVALPAGRTTNGDIAAGLDVDGEWIHARTGVRERRAAATDETLVELASAAAQQALERAKVDPAEVDLVLVASFTQDDVLPNAAPLVAGCIGASGAGAVDVGAACTGFLSALALAAGQVETGRCRHAVVVGADLLSRVIDYTDRRTAGLFGDGAGAVVVSPEGPGRLGRITLSSDASGADLIRASHEERLIRMRGQDTFRAAVDRLVESTREVLDAEGLGLDDVDLFVYHQANARITRAVGERLGVAPERVVDCIERYGNTSAATLPIALAEGAAEGRIQDGTRILLGAFAAGLVWGAGIVECTGEVPS